MEIRVPSPPLSKEALKKRATTSSNFPSAAWPSAAALAANTATAGDTANASSGTMRRKSKEEMKKADMLVLASPIYFFSPSAQLEAAIQRMHAEGIPDNIRESAMILTFGSPGVYEAAKAQYKAIFDYLGTRDRGIFTACGSESRFERKQKELEDFGRSLVS